MFCDFFNRLRRMNVLYFQIEVKVLAPYRCLKIKQSYTLYRHRHVWHHRNKIIRVRRWFSEAVVVVVIT